MRLVDENRAKWRIGSAPETRREAALSFEQGFKVFVGRHSQNGGMRLQPGLGLQSGVIAHELAPQASAPVPLGGHHLR